MAQTPVEKFLKKITLETNHAGDIVYKEVPAQQLLDALKNTFANATFKPPKKTKKKKADEGVPELIVQT